MGCMVEDNPHNLLWFVKQDGVISGPFPLKQIQHDVLLGRLHATTKLSQNKQDWKPLSQLPQLLPEEIRHTASADERERLLLAKMHEDERSGHDRRMSGEESGADEHRHSERRRPESQTVLAHRQAKTDILEEGEYNAPPKGRLFVLMATVAMVGAFVAAYIFVPNSITGEPDCSAAVAPKVNWSNCDLSNRDLVNANLEGASIINARLVMVDLQRANLRGARLAFSNLSGAILKYAEMQKTNLRGTNFQGADLGGINAQGADLSHANLYEANLKGANLKDAKLTGTIWTDGTVCATGSVETCQRMP